LYNEYNYGSYILYQGVPVFIDSRADLYTPEFNGDKDKDIFTDALQIANVSKYYEDGFEKYDFTHLLIPKTIPLLNTNFKLSTFSSMVTFQLFEIAIIFTIWSIPNSPMNIRIGHINLLFSFCSLTFLYRLA